MRKIAVLATFLLFVFTVTAQAAPLPDQKNALAQVPDSSTVVVHLRGVEGTIERIVTFLKNAVPDHALTAEAALNGMLEQGFDGRSLDGLAKDGPVFLTFLGTPEFGAEEPKMAILVKVTGYEKFRNGILKEAEQKGLKQKAGYEATVLENGEPIFFVKKGEFAVITPREDVAKEFTKKQPGVDTKISEAQAEKLMNSDLGIFLKMDVFAKDYADQIKLAKQQVEDALDDAAAGLDASTKSQVEVAAKLIGPLFQAVEDSEGFVASVEFQPKALALHFESSMRDGTTTSKSLKEFDTDTFAALDKLPGNLMFYTGIKTTPAMLQSMAHLAQSGSKPDSEQAKKMKAALDALIAAGPATQLESVGFPMHGVKVAQFKDPQKAVEATLQSLAILGPDSTYSQGMIKGKAKIAKNDQKYKGIDFHHVTAEWDLDKMLAGFGDNPAFPEGAKKQALEGMKKMMGEKLSMWVGTDNERVLQVTAADWKTATKLLDEYTSGKSAIGENKHFAELRKSLPKEATFLGLVDFPSYMILSVEFVKPMLQDQLPIPPGFPAKLKESGTSFAGVSATMKGRRAEFDFVISAQAIQDCYKAFVTPFLFGDV